MQKRFDKKNLIVIAALVLLVAAVALTAMLLKPELNPTLGTLEADPTATPVVTEVPVVTEAPSATEAPAADAAATEAPAAETTDTEGLDSLNADAYLVVSVAGMMYEPIPLVEEGRYSIRRGDLVNVIEVTPTSIKMHESSCDNQDCVEQGTVSLENYKQRVLQNMIICLPNEVVLELYTTEELAQLMLSMLDYTGEETNE
jgi:hypothetical protein